MEALVSRVKKSEPAERVVNSRQGWSRFAAEPLLIQNKKRNPQSGWQKVGRGATTAAPESMVHKLKSRTRGAGGSQ